ncbi:MAG TPA: 2Fe-2S iron-sulfur cluster-binding protein, partial [Acidimicrobiales bacterium]|nr:2Fe-2S iron-sulfur cluster-binding protein [Acidimicrobiales bacterium]
MTPLRRVAGRRVTTVDGLHPEVRRRWADAFVAAGASQCGFCTPGIVLRLAALPTRRQRVDEAAIRSALLAHLCRCTGWETVVDAACDVLAIDRGQPAAAIPDGDTAPDGDTDSDGDTSPDSDASPHPGDTAGPHPDRDALLTSWRA